MFVAGRAFALVGAEGEVVAEVCFIFFDDALCLGFVALIGGMWVVVATVETAVDVASAICADIASAYCTIVDWQSFRAIKTGWSVFAGHERCPLAFS